MAERRIRDDRFPAIKSMENIDFAAQPSIDAAGIRQCRNGRREEYAWEEAMRGRGETRVSEEAKKIVGGASGARSTS